MQAHTTFLMAAMTGRLLMSGVVPHRGITCLDVSKLTEGNYAIRTNNNSWAPIRIVVAH